MGDTDVNVYPTWTGGHWRNGVVIDEPGLQIRFHLGETLDETLTYGPDQAHALVAAARLEGPDYWSNPVRPGRTVYASFGAVDEVLSTNPDWVSVKVTIDDVPLTVSAVKSLIMALRFPLR